MKNSRLPSFLLAPRGRSSFPRMGPGSTVDALPVPSQSGGQRGERWAWMGSGGRPPPHSLRKRHVPSRIRLTECSDMARSALP